MPRALADVAIRGMTASAVLQHGVQRASKYGGDQDGRFIACRHLCRACCADSDGRVLSRLIREAVELLDHAAERDWAHWSNAEGKRLEKAWADAARRAALPGSAVYAAAECSCSSLGFSSSMEPYYLRSSSCESWCDHTCEAKNRNARLDNGEPLVQYWGRWSFDRFAGMAEPGSALASLLNLASPALFLARCGASRWRHGRPHRPLFVWNATLACLAWLASFAYHSFGTELLSRLDLSLAVATTAANTALALSLHSGGLYAPSHTRLLHLLLLAVVGWFCRIWSAHTSPVGESVAFGAVLYLPTVPASVSWAARERMRRPHAWLLPAIASLVLPSFLLEVHDFPPVFGHTIDAHACWHICTVPLYAGFYEFLRREEAHDAAGGDGMRDKAD